MIFHLIIKLIGIRIDAEVVTRLGRINALIETVQAIYLFEFKINSDGETALKQIKEKSYAESYLSSPKAKILVGLSFDTQSRTLQDNWKIETISS